VKPTTLQGPDQVNVSVLFIICLFFLLLEGRRVTGNPHRTRDQRLMSEECGVTAITDKERLIEAKMKMLKSIDMSPLEMIKKSFQDEASSQQEESRDESEDAQVATYWKFSQFDSRRNDSRAQLRRKLD
jgi:uncharacterized protein YwqG